MNRMIAVERVGAAWAVKHNGGFLGYAASEAEARALAENLTAFCRGEESRARPAGEEDRAVAGGVRALADCASPQAQGLAVAPTAWSPGPPPLRAAG